ncbi:23964_t:CDS:1, partial [Dentiscutata erythropus]
WLIVVLKTINKRVVDGIIKHIIYGVTVTNMKNILHRDNLEYRIHSEEETLINWGDNFEEGVIKM